MSDRINVRNFSEPIKELDRLLIPNEIYNLTIQKNTDALNTYFINHPNLMKSFIGFNSTLISLIRFCVLGCVETMMGYPYFSAIRLSDASNPLKFSSLLMFSSRCADTTKYCSFRRLNRSKTSLESI